MLITLHKRIPVKELRKMGKEVILQSEEFFKNNPRRKVAYAQVWYQRIIKIRKKYIKEDVDAAVTEVIQSDKK
jgi:hypothetical protein